MTNKRLKLVPAIARLDTKPRKPTRQQALRQHREVEKWRKAQEPKQ